MPRTRSKTPGPRKGGRKPQPPAGPIPAYLLSLELENVRCFGPRQRLDLSNGQGRPARWTIILGDNGVGKTTLLESLAILISTLGSGRAGEDRLHFFASKERDDRFERELGIIPSMSLMLGAGPKLVEQRMPAAWSTVEADFHLAGTSIAGLELIDELHLHILCSAYGAARRMGTGSLSEHDHDHPLEHLFSEGATLRNAEEWLLQADYMASKPSPLREQARTRFERVKSILVAILPEVEDLSVTTAQDSRGQLVPRVEAKTPYGWVPLRRLGLGYRTMVAWMVDFASRLFECYPDSLDPLAEPAIALIDEIDLHLHPRWQRQLLTYLSERFPNTQFIATAHSPLMVQAASDANLVVLRREGDHVVIDNEPGEVAGWRVDQILTSPLFDLPSARPPNLDRDLQRRTELLARARLTPKEREELRAITERLGDLPTGETPEDIEAMNIIRRVARKLEAREPKTP